MKRIMDSIIYVLGIILFFSTKWSYAEELVDLLECGELVKQGKCKTDREKMFQYCRKSCAEFMSGNQEYESFNIDESDEQFFDLSANTSTGSNLHFDQFEGYITMVINMAKLCKNAKPDAEAYFRDIEEVHEIWPYALELIVFPFEHPTLNYEEDDCTDFEAAALKPGRPIHVMEEVKINGPDEEIHPVIQYLKSRAGIDELETNTGTFFLVNPDGNQVEVLQGASLPNLKAYILRNLKTQYDL